ncbi:hypothetical protein [Hugenholtzia roseola]|uniref:hypothetical protein n=1 Tax=Hugenholtzia roseola TaxID=1002 RepID=UPI000401BFC5|nr:hypothetical protein [Hugenholtzia roseola]
MEKIYESHCGSLLFDIKVPCFHIIWQEVLNLPTVVSFCEAIVEQLQKHRVFLPTLAHFFADTRQLSTIPADISTYWREVWNPQMYQAGGRYLAILPAEAFFAQLILQDYAWDLGKNRLYEGEIDVRFFQSEEAAKVWLMQMRATPE